MDTDVASLLHKGTLAGPLATRLIGIRQEEDCTLSVWPVEHLLLLSGAKEIPPAVIPFAATGTRGLRRTQGIEEHVTAPHHIATP